MSGYQDRVRAATTRVAVAAFHENIGESAFLALAAAALNAFRMRNHLSEEEINLALAGLQSSADAPPLVSTPP